MWSEKCGVLRVQCEVKCWLRRVQCEECSVKSAVWSVKTVKCEVWRGASNVTCETRHQFRRVHARASLAHGACKFYRWERSYIYILYIFKATSAPLRAGTTGIILYYILYYIIYIYIHAPFSSIFMDHKWKPPCIHQPHGIPPWDTSPANLSRWCHSPGAKKTQPDSMKVKADSENRYTVYPLVNIQFAIENSNVIVDLPIENSDFL